MAERLNLEQRFYEIFGSQDISNLPVLRNKDTFKGYEFEEINYDEQQSSSN